ncbi:MAG: HD domain-containing protein, partial [Anaerotignum sp.]|nr:HD domain-containing protein [Anaerotignum sp.]
RGQMYRQKALTASVGICSIPYAASNMKQLMDNADMALYQAKHTGKNKVMIYSIGEVEDSRANQMDNGTGYREGIYSEYASTIYALTAAIDTKDHYTFNHSKNVAEYATKLAKAYGLNSESVSIIHEAALLHDIGKIGIPEHILNKPGRLEAEEYEVMKEHVENSIGIIRHLPSLDYVIPAVIGHHERWDGRGYPRRIAGEDIPLSARILCIADSFDAMVSKRSYKDAYGTERAISIVKNEAGRQFDPQLAELFVTLVENGTITVLKDE